MSGRLRLAAVPIGAAIWILLLTGCNSQTMRALRWRDADMGDIHRFQAREIPNAPPVLHFHTPTSGRYDPAFGPVTLETDDGAVTRPFDTFLEERDTWAFIVLRRDTLVLERYFAGRDRSSVETTFSVSKSLVSLAVGVALDSGWISSVQDPVTRYLPELAERDTDFQGLTLEHLLTMTSGVRFQRSGSPWGDQATSYYNPDLRRVALERDLSDPPGTRFQYNFYNPIVLGLALERASERPLTRLLSEAIWTRIGAEHPASWSVDGDSATGFEKMESGFNATALDLARLGRLVLHRGMLDGDTIVSPTWVDASVRPDSTAGRSPAYGYMWWLERQDDGSVHYWAEGRFGQFVYVVPALDLVMVRTGETDGDVQWPSLFQRVARGVAEVDTGG